MTRSPARDVFAILLAAVLAAAPRASYAASAAMDAQRAALLRARDPNSAERFLADSSLQTALRAEDEKAELDLFRAAAELRDLRQLLRGYQQEDRVIREGLAARPDCSFCQDPRQLLDWADRYQASPHDFLRGALLEWDTLPPARSRWLADRGVARAQWDKTPFVARQAKIREWGMAEYEQIMKSLPEDQAALDKLGVRANEINDALDHDQAYALGQRVEKAEAAVKAMAEAEKRLAQSGTPELRAALAAAKNAPDLETRLANLGRVFDGLNVPNEAVHSAAPLKPGQGFDDATRQLTAEMLGPALLREVDGTWAGAELKAFYAKVPMKITVKPEDAGSLAAYSEGVMNFGSGEIEDFLKARGRSARDLLTDPALLHDLTRELAPVFVHEATHHRQDVWAKERGIRGAWSQYQEIEAMETESIYALEKIARDPSYKAYLAKSAETSPNAREVVSLARRLETGGADQFRRSIQALHYPGLLSLEGETWSWLVRRDKADAAIRAELGRRAALSPVRRAALYLGPDLAEEYDTRDELLAAVRAAGTARLERFLTAAARKDASEPGAYAQHRARLEGVNRATEEHLRELQAETDPAKPKHSTVPAPGRGGPG